MDKEFIESLLNSDQKRQLDAIEKQASTLLDHTPRFKYFTLHGKEHIQNLYNIVKLLCKAGLSLNNEQAFLLACSICVHDLGMVIPLRDFDQSALLYGKPQPADPANLELLAMLAAPEKTPSQKAPRAVKAATSFGAAFARDDWHDDLPTQPSTKACWGLPIPDAAISRNRAPKWVKRLETQINQQDSENAL